VTTFNDRRGTATQELSTFISGEEPIGGDSKFFATNSQLSSRELSGGGLPRRTSLKKKTSVNETTSTTDMR
jgi:hypothetical protein